MKEKSKTSCFSTILYIVSALVTAVYFYLGFKGYSPFLRAGVMVCACVFLYLGTRLRARNCGAQTARMQMKKAFAVMFFLYAFMLVSFLFFEGYFGRDSVSFEGFSEYFRESTNLVPFRWSTLAEIWWRLCRLPFFCRYFLRKCTSPYVLCLLSAVR